ncbi:hypothetical protein IU485_27910 [Nocardia cyriacigeorgica]|uniref:hypothetical protein n=1 Tax=Nocardia cyriacigeorgica TaxID=135487 RepID=UPI001895D203|nr:hypothetical protein [Nocardia cyriacigeorgica]MBF6085204.1 hypothetical protein [Nocardia cyriacigeorgica]
MTGAGDGESSAINGIDAEVLRMAAKSMLRELEKNSAYHEILRSSVKVPTIPDLGIKVPPPNVFGYVPPESFFEQIYSHLVPDLAEIQSRAMKDVLGMSEVADRIQEVLGGYTAQFLKTNLVTALPVIDVRSLWVDAVPRVVPDAAMLGIDSTITDLVKKVLEDIASRYPDNWPEDFTDLAVAQQIVEADGIPIVYVPRADIVAELVEQPDRAGRVCVILARVADIADDCMKALEEPITVELECLRPLLRKAVAALKDGHGESAQALAVNLVDTLLRNVHRNRTVAAQRCVVKNIVASQVSKQLRYDLGVAPIVRLWTEWDVASPHPRPAEPSRHVTIHNAHPDHYTPENAVICVMIATSLILALNEKMIGTQAA